MSEAQVLDLDELLDGTLDNVEDVPEFVSPPSGRYHLAVSNAEVRKNSDKTKPARLSIQFTVKETISVDSEDELPVPDDSLFSDSFQATEQGLGYFKQAAKRYLQTDDISGVSVRDILEALKDDVSFYAVVTTTTSGVYTNSRIRVVSEEAAKGEG